MLWGAGGLMRTTKSAPTARQTVPMALAVPPAPPAPTAQAEVERAARTGPPQGTQALETGFKPAGWGPAMVPLWLPILRR